MTPTITAEHDGQTFPVALHLITGLDALVYRRTTGEELDARLWTMITNAPDSPTDWMLADKAVIGWLFVRQAVDPNADLTTIAAGLTLFPPPAADAAGIDAPGAD